MSKSQTLIQNLVEFYLCTKENKTIQIIAMGRINQQLANLMVQANLRKPRETLIDSYLHIWPHFA